MRVEYTPEEQAQLDAVDERDRSASAVDHLTSALSYLVPDDATLPGPSGTELRPDDIWVALAAWTNRVQAQASEERRRIYNAALVRAGGEPVTDRPRRRSRKAR